MHLEVIDDILLWLYVLYERFKCYNLEENVAELKECQLVGQGGLQINGMQ